MVVARLVERLLLIPEIRSLYPAMANFKEQKAGNGPNFKRHNFAWIAEWYNTRLRTLECCTLGHEFQPSVRTKLFRLKYKIFAQEHSEEDEIKTGNTNIDIIIC